MAIASRRSSSRKSGERSELALLGPGGAPPHASSRASGASSEVLYSPDGEWLLLAWRSADQWLFLNPADPRRVVAISDIAAQFDPGTTSPPSFPESGGLVLPAPDAAIFSPHEGNKSPRRDLSKRPARIGGMRPLAFAPLLFLLAFGVGCGSSGSSASEAPAPVAESSAPLSPAATDFNRMRDKVVLGLATDFRAGTHAGPDGFGLCVRLGMRRVLTRAQLSRLVSVYRRPGGQAFAAQALNAWPRRSGPNAAARSSSRS